MNHDMRIGTIVYLRESDAVGVEGFRRRMSAGHVVDHKRRPHLVTAVDDFGMVLAGLTTRPIGTHASFELPASLRLGPWPPDAPAQTVRDLRRAVVIRWGSAAHFLVHQPATAGRRRYNMKPVEGALARMHHALRIHFSPKRLWESIHV